MTDADYQRLLELRDAMRQFLAWSAEQAHAVGLTPAQHQLLLAVRGHRGGPPTIGEVAEHLMLKHHSAVGLVDRSIAAGLVQRRRDDPDGRVVHLALTAKGRRLLAKLSAAHAAELEGAGGSLRRLLAPAFRTTRRRRAADRPRRTRTQRG